jgi:hypothetical protein
MPEGLPYLKIASEVLASFALISSDLERCRDVVNVGGNWEQVSEEWTTCYQALQNYQISYRNSLKLLLSLIVNDKDEVDRLLDEPNGARWTPEYCMPEWLQIRYHQIGWIIMELKIATEELRKHFDVDEPDSQSKLVPYTPTGRPPSMSTIRTTNTRMFHDVFRASQGERQRLIMKLKKCNDHLEKLLATSYEAPIPESIDPDSTSHRKTSYSHDDLDTITDSELIANDEKSYAISQTTLDLTFRRADGTPRRRRVPEVFPPSTGYKHQQPSTDDPYPYVWFCSQCDDGPYGDWQTVCQACAHAKCKHCPIERQDPQLPPIPVDTAKSLVRGAAGMDEGALETKQPPQPDATQPRRKMERPQYDVSEGIKQIAETRSENVNDGIHHFESGEDETANQRPNTLDKEMNENAIE